MPYIANSVHIFSESDTPPNSTSILVKWRPVFVEAANISEFTLFLLSRHPNTFSFFSFSSSSVRSLGRLSCDREWGIVRLDCQLSYRECVRIHHQRFFRHSSITFPHSLQMRRHQSIVYTWPRIPLDAGSPLPLTHPVFRFLEPYPSLVQASPSRAKSS